MQAAAGAAQLRQAQEQRAEEAARRAEESLRIQEERLRLSQQSEQRQAQKPAVPAGAAVRLGQLLAHPGNQQQNQD